MADASKPRFTFESKGMAKDTFHVVSFRGEEGLSTIYRFEIDLVSEKSDVDFDSALQNPAVLTVKRDNGDVTFNGILSSFEQGRRVDGLTYYQAVLVPRLWRLTLTRHNQIFLNKNAQGFLGDVFKDGGLSQGISFDFKLQGSYPDWEYLCQYDETHFNFVSRWMERDGMYYYYEQSEQGEKMVVTDTHLSHGPMSQGASLTYSPPSGLSSAHKEEVIENFLLRQQPLPKKVLLKDYNYRKPSLEMKAEATVSSKGVGQVYIYGEHFFTPDQGNKLAKIRAEELLCREKLFHGASSVPYIAAGYTFELKDHYRNDFNQRYLTISAVHEGGQTAYLTAGLGLPLSGLREEEGLYYRNSFTAIPAAVQFRAQRTAETPKFHGTMNAKIDAAGSGKYAELDDQGRYKVILPLDESGRSGGKATTWLRMAQPYAGSDHGMHFPLHKGTEVLLTCIDGDPDRPIIQSAAPNPETPSPVTDADATQARITTAGQNKIHMEDQDGKQRILLQTPTYGTFFRLGSTNDPPSPPPPDAEAKRPKSGGESNEPGEWGINLVSEKGLRIQAGGKNEILLGEDTDVVVGNKLETIGGAKEEIILSAGTVLALTPLGALSALTPAKLELILGGLMDIVLGWELAFKPVQFGFTGSETKVKGEIAKVEGSVERMRGNIDSLVGETVKIKGDQIDTAASVQRLRGSIDTLDGQVGRVQAQVNRVIGDAQRFVGASQRAYGELSSAIGDLQRVVGAMNQVNGEMVVVNGELSEINGEQNDVAGEMNTVTTLALTM